MLRDEPEVLALFREAMHGTLAAHGGNHVSKPKEEQGSDATLIGRGNDYWQARIARDCPEELEAIKRGKDGGGKTIMQVRQEQGWGSPSKRVTLTGGMDAPAEDALEPIEYVPVKP